MTITTAQVEKLLTGNHRFSHVAFSIMLTRLKKIYNADPSPNSLKKCTDEINAFVKIFSSILGTELAVISKL